MGGLTGGLPPSGEVSLEEVLSNAVFFSLFTRWLASSGMANKTVLHFLTDIKERTPPLLPPPRSEAIHSPAPTECLPPRDFLDTSWTLPGHFLDTS